MALICAESFPAICRAEWFGSPRERGGSIISPTWTPGVCKIMAFMAVIMGSGLLFYILLGFR